MLNFVQEFSHSVTIFSWNLWWKCIGVWIVFKEFSSKRKTFSSIFFIFYDLNIKNCSSTYIHAEGSVCIPIENSSKRSRKFRMISDFFVRTKLLRIDRMTRYGSSDSLNFFDEIIFSFLQKNVFSRRFSSLFFIIVHN